MTGYNKTTFRFNGEQKYGKLTVGANVAYSLSTFKRPRQQEVFTVAKMAQIFANYGYGWARSDDMTRYLNEDGTKYRMFFKMGIWLPTVKILTGSSTKTNCLTKHAAGRDPSRKPGRNRLVSTLCTGLVWIPILMTSIHTLLGGAVSERYQNGRLSKSDKDLSICLLTLC